MEENKPKPTSVDNNIKTIHTYTSDMADTVRINEASVIKIAMAEKEKREQEAIYKKAGGTSVSKFFWALGGIILLGAVGVGSYFLFKMNKNTIVTPQSVIPVMQSIISYDDQSYVDISKAQTTSDIADAINPEIQKTGKPGSIKSLFLTESTDGKAKLVPLEDLLSVMKITAPQTLIRTLSDQYMVGTYTPTNTETSSHLFLILQIKDFNQAYAAMLGWEPTMLDDLFTLFHVDVTGSRSALFEKPWKDIIINNKDARILYDVDGNDVLYYIFADKNDIIITDNQEAIKEISSRILAKTIKPL